MSSKTILTIVAWVLSIAAFIKPWVMDYYYDWKEAKENREYVKKLQGAEPIHYGGVGTATGTLGRLDYNLFLHQRGYADTTRGLLHSSAYAGTAYGVAIKRK